MLSKAHRVYHWTRPGRSISSDRLDDAALPHLARAISAYRRGIGWPRGRLRDAVRAVLAELRPDRVEAVVELLDDVSTYDWPRGGRAGERRLTIFETAAREHPVIDADRSALILRQAFGPAAVHVVHSLDAVPLLYADYPEYHRLTAFPADYDPPALRADYDLAQAQALLYDAIRVTVEATGDLKHIVQYARLSRLLHRLELADARAATASPSRVPTRSSGARAPTAWTSPASWRLWCRRAAGTWTPRCSCAGDGDR